MAIARKKDLHQKSGWEPGLFVVISVRNLPIIDVFSF